RRVCVAVLGIWLNAKVGPMFGGGGHHGGGEEARSWPTALPGDADVLIKHARVVQPGYAEASVIAIRNGKIIGVGGDELLHRRTATTAIHDLNGAYVVPGLIDAHGHLAGLGEKLNQRVCDLSEVNGSRDDVVRHFETWIKIRKGEPKPGDLLEGHGWDESKWVVLAPPSAEDLARAEKEKRDFTKEPDQGFRRVPATLPDSTEPLDQIAPDNPVVLYRVDGHTAWVNHKALELAKIDKNTFNPPGGRILRDRDGEPTGVLVDDAIDLVLSKLPRKSEDQRIIEAEEDILAGAKACARAGLTEVHDAGVSLAQEHGLRRLAKANRLPIRVYAMVSGSQQQLAERLSRPGPVKDPIGDRLTIRAVKLLADGAMGSRGAHLLQPYSDEPGTSGLTKLSKEEIAGAARLCIEHGWQLCIHAIGDAANREVLEVYEEVLGDRKDLRWRVEHAQLVDPADFHRFAKLGVIASMQPTHATSDMRWAENRLGSKRLAGAYAWRSLLDAHARLAFGSDFPVESERPVYGLYAAVTRKDDKGNPDGGWLPKQKVTPEEALALFTEGAAYAGFAEQRRGKILPGFDADFTVFKENPLEVLAREPRRLLEMNPAEKGFAGVVATFVGGVDVSK
ncbi:MAG: amidohydrolase, partial [Planctomycetota bacterium]